MSYLAIKGHATRGNEIIEILEMLGGKNDHYYSCNITDYVYGINRQGIIDWNIPHPDSFLTVFTLEEFFEKYPYKVEDKVNYVKYNDEYPNVYTIQGMQWTGATIEYLLDSCGFSALTKDLQPYKEETMEEKNNDNWAKWDLPDGYEFQDKDGNIINTSVIRLVKKQPQYPKTYGECCKVIGFCPDTLTWNNPFYISRDTHPYIKHLDNLIESFCKLIICRDAYWKIAGKQMGLSEPWEPKNPSRRYVFTIENFGGNIQTNAIAAIMLNRILVFPTAEMRDAFYENFKELIELVKELL